MASSPCVVVAHLTGGDIAPRNEGRPWVQALFGVLNLTTTRAGSLVVVYRTYVKHVKENLHHFPTLLSLGRMSHHECIKTARWGRMCQKSRGSDSIHLSPDASFTTRASRKFQMCRQHSGKPSPTSIWPRYQIRCATNEEFALSTSNVHVPLCNNYSTSQKSAHKNHAANCT